MYNNVLNHPHAGVPGHKKNRKTSAKQQWNPLVPLPDPLRPMFPPRNPVYKNNGQDWWQWTCLRPSCTGNRSELLPAMQLSSCSDWTETRQALVEGPRAPPAECHKAHSWKPSSSPSNMDMDYLGKLQWTLKHPPCRECRSGPVFHGWDWNGIAPFESKVRTSVIFSSPVPWQRLSKGGWGPHVHNSHLSSNMHSSLNCNSITTFSFEKSCWLWNHTKLSFLGWSDVFLYQVHFLCRDCNCNWRQGKNTAIYAGELAALPKLCWADC